MQNLPRKCFRPGFTLNISPTLRIHEMFKAKQSSSIIGEELPGQSQFFKAILKAQHDGVLTIEFRVN